MKIFSFSTLVVCLLTTNTYADFSGKVYMYESNKVSS